MHQVRIGKKRPGVEPRGVDAMQARRDQSEEKTAHWGVNKNHSKEGTIIASSGLKRPTSRVVSHNHTIAKRTMAKGALTKEEGRELTELGQEIRAPSVHPVERVNSRGPTTGRVVIQTGYQPPKPSGSNSRMFKLKDKQLYNKVWHPQNEENNPPPRPNRYDRQGSEDKIVNISRENLIKEKTNTNHITIRPPIHYTDYQSDNNDPQKNFGISRGHLKNTSPNSNNKADVNFQNEQRAAFRITKRQNMTGGPHRAADELQNYRAPDSPSQDHSHSVDAVREEVIFEAFDGNDEELLKAHRDYLPRIINKNHILCQHIEPEELKTSFSKSTWVMVWKKKRYSRDSYLDSSTIGLLIYQLDLGHFKSRRMNITHISSIEYDNHFNKYLAEAVNHIFTTDQCAEIHLQFKHIRDHEDKLNLPVELKESAKTAGFRWRMMVNSADGTRLTVFEAKRGPQYSIPDTSICTEPIKQLGLVVMSDKEVEQTRSLLSSERQFRSRILTNTVPYDRLMMTFAAFTKYTKNTYKNISGEVLRDLGRVGELISSAKSHEVLQV